MKLPALSVRRLPVAAPVLAIALATGLSGPGAGAARAKSKMPPLPASPVQTFQPDLATCQPEQLLRGYRQQLAAYADQPPAVVEQLKLLQRDMAVASINRCISKGLLSKEQASQLATSMGIERDR